MNRRPSLKPSSQRGAVEVRAPREQYNEKAKVPGKTFGGSMYTRPGFF